MSEHHRALKLAILYSSLAVLTGACVSVSEYREVLSISDITQNVMDAGIAPVICGDFRLTTKQVMYYFRHAREVAKGTYAHDLYYAPCHVIGNLELRNGITATWEINLSGSGRIVFDDGRYMYLSCERCIPKQ